MRERQCNWPSALISRWFPVTDVERRLTSPLLVASSDCSRCLKTLVVFRKFFSEKRAQAATNQRMPLVTHLNTKDMLTAIDTAETCNETFAQFQARESWWEREVMENFNVPAFHFVMHVLHQSRGPADNPFDSVSVPLTRSVAVDRELPSRVPMIESVCSAAEAIFIEYYTLLEKTWAVGLLTRLLYVMCQGSCG